MKDPKRVTLEKHGVRLEPLSREHADAIGKAAADGELWSLWVTSVPAPGEAQTYIATALGGYEAGHMLPFVVRELSSGAIVGSTRYHDIVKPANRVEIGYTSYAKRWQKSHVNTACKLMLLAHAFDHRDERVLENTFHQAWTAAIHIDRSRADSHVAEASLPKQRIQPATNQCVASQPGLQIDQALNRPRSRLRLRIAQPRSVVAFDHRNGSVSQQDSLNRCESSRRLSQVLEHKAQKDVVKVRIAKGQLEYARLVKFHIPMTGSFHSPPRLFQRGR